MILTHKLSMHLDKWAEPVQITAVQSDRYCRQLQVSFLAEEAPWPIPKDTQVVIRYAKSDGTGGEYDTLPDGSQAWHFSGSTLTAALAPQVLTAVGPVQLTLQLILGQAMLHSFPIKLLVQPNTQEAIGTSESYYHVRGFLPQPEAAAPGQMVRITAVDESGKVLSTEGIIPEALAFDSGYTDESGFLHLTKDGEDLPKSDFQPFYVGGGSDSGMSSAISLTCGLPALSFAIAGTDEHCVIPYSWASVDTGNSANLGTGKAIWQVNGIQKAIQSVAQGDNRFDIRPFLLDNADNQVLLTIQDLYGNSKNLLLGIRVVSCRFSWNLAAMENHGQQDVLLRLNAAGDGEKTVRVTLDGAEILKEAVSASSKTLVVQIPAQSHGIHRIAATMEASGNPTQTLQHTGIWQEAGNTAPIVCLGPVSGQQVQYGTVQIPYLVSDPASDNARIQLWVDGMAIEERTVSRELQAWVYGIEKAGQTELKITCGDANAQVTLNAGAFPYSVTPVTTGLKLDADARRDGEFGFVDAEGVLLPFTLEGWGWENGGIQADGNGGMAFVIPRGCRIVSNESLFFDLTRKNGKNIKLIFKTGNVADSDTEILRCMTGNVGLVLTPEKAYLSSELESLEARYCAGELTELDVCIQPDSEDSLAYLCLDGVPACPPIQYTASDSWTQSSAGKLTIGSDLCDVWLYRIKLYGSTLSPMEVLQNFIADSVTPAQMAQRFCRNDIFTGDGQIDPGKLAAAAPDLRVLSLSGNRLEMHHGIQKLSAEGIQTEERDSGIALSLPQGYAFTEHSTPSTEFVLYKDTNDSGCANDVCLSAEYQAFSPAVTGLRSCPEGAVAAVFEGSSLRFAGHMANSPQDAALYGFGTDADPNAFCIRLLSNDSPQCRFRSDDLRSETWDGTGNFAFRFPETGTDEMKAAFASMLSWVVSTTVDLATGSPLEEKAIFDDIAYTTDTAEYRKAKFLAEFDTYFQADSLLFYYLFIQRHSLVNSRAKNLCLCYEYDAAAEGYRWNARCGLDFSAAQGCNELGQAAFAYGMEEEDQVNETPVFAASDSTLWVNLRTLMPQRLREAYLTAKEKGAWDAGRILSNFAAAQVPEGLRMVDAWSKYIQPLRESGLHIPGCNGSKRLWRQEYETHQSLYMDSKYQLPEDTDGSIRLHTSFEAGKSIQLTPNQDMYLNIRFGNAGFVTQRAKKGSVYTLAAPAGTVSDGQVVIYNANALAGVRQLAWMAPISAELSQAHRLLDLELGNWEGIYQNRNLTQVRLQNNAMLRILDLRGLRAAEGPLDLSHMQILEQFYGTDSAITGLTFATGCPLKIAHLPELTHLTARQLLTLEDFRLEATHLRSLLVENCPAIDTLALCKAAVSLERGRLPDVDWQDHNADLLLRLASLSGLDTLGNDTEHFVLTGKAHLKQVTMEDVAAVEAAFPELTLSYDNVVGLYTVSFQDSDGAPLPGATQQVRQGENAVDPVAAGMIPLLTKASTVEKNYRFTGWSGSLEAITADTVLTAVYEETDRRYLVRFWADDAETHLYHEESVICGQVAHFLFPDPVGPEKSIWLGWDVNLFNVRQNLDAHPKFLLPELPDRMRTSHAYAYSDDPGHDSAYTLAEFYGIHYYNRVQDFLRLGDKVYFHNQSEGYTDSFFELELRSFKHFKSAERADAWAGPYYGMTHCMAASLKMLTSGSTYDYRATNLCQHLTNTVHPQLPKLMLNLMERISVLIRDPASSSSGTPIHYDTYLTPESHEEIFGIANSDFSCYEEGANEIQFSCYTTATGRIKNLGDTPITTSGATYWTRTYRTSSYWYACSLFGDSDDRSATTVNGVSFGFCIRTDWS